jgi:hypothetical protein
MGTEARRGASGGMFEGLAHNGNYHRKAIDEIEIPVIIARDQLADTAIDILQRDVGAGIAATTAVVAYIAARARL